MICKKKVSNIDGVTLRNESEMTICHKDIEYYKYTSCKIWDSSINTISILHSGLFNMHRFRWKNGPFDF